MRDIERRIALLTNQRDTVERLVAQFCTALGEPVPQDAIRRAEQLRGAVEALERLEKAGRRALAQWQDPHGEDLYHQHAFESALDEARTITGGQVERKRAAPKGGSLPGMVFARGISRGGL